MSHLLRGMVSVALLVAAGCAHKPVTAPTALTLQNFWEEQKQRLRNSGTFSGKVTLDLNTKVEKISGSGRVVGAGERRTRVELRDPLGRIQYLLVQVPGKVMICLQASNLCYEDIKDGSAYFRRNLGHSFTVTELRKLWLGIVPIRHGTLLDKWQWNSERGCFRAEKRDGKISWELFIDGENATLRELKLSVATQLFRVEYSDFEDVDHVKLAHTVKLFLPEVKEKLEVEWEDLIWGQELRWKGGPQSFDKVDISPGTKIYPLR